MTNGMINYLEKYNNLPKEIKDKISSPQVMEAIHDMEKRYSVNLATVVMRVMVKDLRIDELSNYFVYTMSISADKATTLIDELRKKVFSEISNYLDYINEPKLNASDELKFEDNEEGKNHDEDDDDKSKGAAQFYFSIEDEDEVRTQAQDFSKYDRRELVARQVEGKIENILAKINVIFSSEDMLKRLKKVLHTYLYGVRDKIDTMETLKRPIDKGGLGLDDEIADDIVKVVDLINHEEASHPGETKQVKKPIFRVPEDRVKNSDEEIVFDSQSSVDMEYDFSKLQEKDTAEAEDDTHEDDMVPPHLKEEHHNDTKENIKDLGHLGEDEPGGSDLVLDLSEEDSSAEQVEPTETTTEEEPQSKEESPETDEVDTTQAEIPIARARTKPAIKIDYEKKLTVEDDSGSKVRMEDIKKVHKLGGPLEEVGNMDLKDFRRLGDVKVAIRKIMNMFDLLEEESFNKKMSGIKAWRKSPLNKLYLMIGQESMTKQRDIAQIIERRKKDGKEYLSKEEFDAIMELNKKLRY